MKIGLYVNLTSHKRKLKSLDNFQCKLKKKIYLNPFWYFVDETCGVETSRRMQERDITAAKTNEQQQLSQITSFVAQLFTPHESTIIIPCISAQMIRVLN